MLDGLRKAINGGSKDEELSRIEQKVKRFFGNTSFLKLKTRMDADMDLYNLEPFNAGRNFTSVTVNIPQTDADKVMLILQGMKLIIRIPDDDLTSDERDSASVLERFLYGVLQLNDERCIRLSTPSIREAIGGYLVLRGGCFIRTFVYKDDKGKTNPRIDIWDRRNVAYGTGKEGLLWAAHCYTTTAENAESEWGISFPNLSPDSVVHVIDYWDEKKNAVIINGQWAKKPTPHGLDYCPVYRILPWISPPVYSYGPQDTKINYDKAGAKIGESFFSANRDMYPVLSKSISDRMTIVDRGLNPTVIIKSRNGKRTLDANPYIANKTTTIALASDETIELLKPQTTPPDTDRLIGEVAQLVENGGLPSSVYGRTGNRQSGFSINQSQAYIETAYQAFANALTKAYTIICREMIAQFKTGLPALQLHGTDSRGRAFGRAKKLKVSPSNLKRDWDLDISLVQILPKDDAQRYMLAQQAGQADLLSKQTIQENLLGVEDTNRENERQLREKARNIPTVWMLQSLLAALSDGRVDIAMAITQELRLLQQKMGLNSNPEQAPMSPGSMDAGKQSALNAMAMTMRGVGQPSGPTGMPSNMYPPEMSGGLPSGALNAKENEE
ncbi:hypothetical protein [Dehalococcoides sp. THU4]|uniref:hypothetical protein n=1 Tax=Dehalococcoides sp. THU4 TaxID=3348344 RepID=UPI003715FB6D